MRVHQPCPIGSLKWSHIASYRSQSPIDLTQNHKICHHWKLKQSFSLSNDLMMKSVYIPEVFYISYQINPVTILLLSRAVANELYGHLHTRLSYNFVWTETGRNAYRHKHILQSYVSNRSVVCGKSKENNINYLLFHTNNLVR